MERILGVDFAHLQEGDENEVQEYFRQYCRFFREMTYDTVSFEVCVTDILPGHGAIMGGRPGPIQNRIDFEEYPWDELPLLFWRKAERQYMALSQAMPQGMKAVGGIGNGVFEIAEDLVGYEHLSYMQIDDPELFTDLYTRIGDLLVKLWRQFLRRFAEHYAVCRFGDDLGFKTSLLVRPETIKKHIIPQYRRVVDLVHQAGRCFLWHSCGCIFEIMEEMLAVGIDAKHSNEDVIAPFDIWIKKYGSRIGLLGGFDVDLLCTGKSDDIKHRIIEDGQRFRNSAKGYAIGSGNSIPDYVPVDGYMTMVEAVQIIRENERR